MNLQLLCMYVSFQADDHRRAQRKLLSIPHQVGSATMAAQSDAYKSVHQRRYCLCITVRRIAFPDQQQHTHYNIIYMFCRKIWAFFGDINKGFRPAMAKAMNSISNGTINLARGVRYPTFIRVIRTFLAIIFGQSVLSCLDHRTDVVHGAPLQLSALRRLYWMIFVISCSLLKCVVPWKIRYSALRQTGGQVLTHFASRKLVKQVRYQKSTSK